MIGPNFVQKEIVQSINEEFDLKYHGKMRKPRKLTVLTPISKTEENIFFRHQKLVKQHFAKANFQLNRCETRLLILY